MQERRNDTAGGDSNPTAQVAILLGTYNGERFLDEQLDSIAAQTHPHWKVWASDDGSQDRTLSILNDYQRRWSADRLSILLGPSKGFVANFLTLACHPDIEADYYAFCDQDDIWEPDKLARALSWLQTIPSQTPALYCGRTRLVNEAGKEIGLSPLFTRPPSFANALVQSIAGANTMVFNQPARALLREAGVIDVASHDWWLYLLVAGCGGQVFYDPIPSIRYRQHISNLVGGNATWSARIQRLRMLWQGRFAHWTNLHLSALQPLLHHLTPHNRQTLRHFIHSREAIPILKPTYLTRSGVYRQTFFGNVGLFAATIFRRV